jgi:hypothetical protein
VITVTVGYAPWKPSDFAAEVKDLMRAPLADVEHIAAIERHTAYRVLRTQFRALEREDPAGYQRVARFLRPRKTGVTAVLKYVLAPPDKRPSSVHEQAAIPVARRGNAALVMKSLANLRIFGKNAGQPWRDGELAAGAARDPPIVPEDHPLQRHIIMNGKQGLEEIRRPAMANKC